MKKIFSVSSLIVFIVMLFSCTNNKKATPIKEEGLPDTIIAINRLIDERPRDASLYALRSDLFFDYRMIDRALADIDHAIFLDSRNPSHYVQKADILFSRGRVHESISHLKKARSISQTDIKPLLKLGEIFLFIENYDKSLAYLDSAAKLDDTNPEPWLIGGFTLYNAGDTLKSIRYFNECLIRDKDNYKANIQLAVIYTRMKNPLAFEYYENALRIDPSSAEAYYNMGTLFQDLEMYNEAIDAYITVTRLEKDMGFRDNAFYNLGYIHIELKVYDAARDYFGHAIRENPKYFQAYYAKGYTHEVLGDLQNAKAYYDKAIDLYPGYTAAREAMHRVLGLIRTPL